MTPLQISIMLHYYTTAWDYRDGDFSAPAVRETIDYFVDEEMLGVADVAGKEVPYLRITPKGTVFVDALCAVPLPVRQWVIPEHNGGAT